MTTYLAIENAKALIFQEVECHLLWHLTSGDKEVVVFAKEAVEIDIKVVAKSRQVTSLNLTSMFSRSL